jgi:hypothetical protein
LGKLQELRSSSRMEVEKREVERGPGSRRIPELGVGGEDGTWGTWASAPVLCPPTVESQFVKCHDEGRRVSQRSEGQRFGGSEVQRVRGSEGVNVIFELQVLQLSGTYIQVCLLSVRVQ